MRFRGFLKSVNDSNSVAHGAVSAALVAGLALIEPRGLTTGRRLAYRGAIAVFTAWTVWASLRPRQEEDLDLIGPIGRAAVTVGGAGSALGIAEAAEAIDARVHDGLVRVGARRPRLWLAAGEAALSLVAWWVGERVGDQSSSLFDFDEPVEQLVALPEELRQLAERILAATDEHGAPQLRDQLAVAKAVSFDDGAIEMSFAQFNVPESLPRAVPGTATFPVIGRFRALGDRSFDIRLFVDNGRLESIRLESLGRNQPKQSARGRLHVFPRRSCQCV